jgi:hypothetical protein
MPKTRTRKPLFAVKVGDCFELPRPGKPARHVRIVRILGRTGHQPKAKYVLITRIGKRKTKRGMEITTWLTWDADLGQWRVPWARASRYEVP